MCKDDNFKKPDGVNFLGAGFLALALRVELPSTEARTNQFFPCVQESILLTIEAQQLQFPLCV